jgi:neutral ceramidase
VGRLLVGAARLSLEPPLDLPLIGFMRQTHDATGYGRFGLETSAIGLELDGRRVVLCGVDIVGIGEPEISVLLDRVARATGADPAGILLNWNHTHLAALGGTWGGELTGPPEPERDTRIRRFADVVQDKIVSVCRAAFSRLTEARPVWGVGWAELAVNRRERSAGGETILGWNPDNLVDNQVTSLQLRRPDESVVATAVNYGCHPVTTGFDLYDYSADFPGPLREVVRRNAGGEVVFLQGAGGNVLPKVAFTPDETEAEYMGTRLGLEAVHSLCGRFAYRRRMEWKPEQSVMRISAYRRAQAKQAPVELAATVRRVRFPLLALPSLTEIQDVLAEWEPKLEAAIAAGEGGAARIAYWHAGWARKVERALLDRTATPYREGRIHAIRIGDGVVVSGPGEVFTEIGMAVKERSPGNPTMYAGFTNGLIAYFATAAEYAHGGYEADYSRRGHGNVAHVAPECERLLIESGVRAAEELFPGATPWRGEDGWTATGSLPAPTQPDPLDHPGWAATSEATAPLDPASGQHLPGPAPRA